MASMFGPANAMTFDPAMLNAVMAGLGGEGGAPNLSPTSQPNLTALFNASPIGPAPAPTPVTKTAGTPSRGTAGDVIPTRDPNLVTGDHSRTLEIIGGGSAIPEPVVNPIDTGVSIVPERSPEMGMELEELLFGPNGVLSQGAALQSVGMLSPSPSRGQATELGEQAALQTATSLQSDFLPQLMNIFSNITSANLADTPQAQAALELATRPIEEQLRFSALPSVEDAAIAAGQKGSSREGIAEGLVGKAAVQAKADIGTRFAQDLMQRSFQNQIAGLQLSPQLIASQLVPSQLFGGVGQQQEEFAEEVAGSPAANLRALANLANAVRNPEQDLDDGPSDLEKIIGTGISIAGLF